MASKNNESSPLLGKTASNPGRVPTSRTQPLRPQRQVTFNPLTQISTQPGVGGAGPPLRPAHSPSAALSGQNVPVKEPMLSGFNSRLRRRNSHGAPLPSTQASAGVHRYGARRTTKDAEKLKILPNPEVGLDEESGRDVYSQFTRIKDPTARRDAARLGRADRERLPRVTAYCMAQEYRLEPIMKFMKSRARTRGAKPILFDECLYSPYDYDYLKKKKATEIFSGQQGVSSQRPSSRSPVEERLNRIIPPSPRIQPGERRYSDSAVEVEEQQKTRREDLIDLQESLEPAILEEDPMEQSLAPRRNSRSISTEDLTLTNTNSNTMFESDQPDLSTTVDSPEVFVFEYGTIVLWGMTPPQEQRFLNDMSKFANLPLPADSIQTEDFNFYYTKEYQARIYNDFISLRDPRNYMTKLAISHALSQSVKTSLFEDLVSDTIETTSPLPALIAQTGSVNLTRRQLNMQIGELFILRINIHLQGSVLDSPELMWAEPHLEPVYAAVRSYLEIGQRVGLLTERLDVISGEKSNNISSCEGTELM